MFSTGHHPLLSHLVMGDGCITMTKTHRRLLLRGGVLPPAHELAPPSDRRPTREARGDGRDADRALTAMGGRGGLKGVRWGAASGRGVQLAVCGVRGVVMDGRWWRWGRPRGCN